MTLVTVIRNAVPAIIGQVMSANMVSLAYTSMSLGLQTELEY